MGARETGNETYVVNLLRALLAEERGLCVLPLTPRPRALEGPLGPEARRRALRVWPPTPWLRVPLGIPWVARRHGLALLHMTYILPPWCPAPVVLTVHDLSFTTFPETFSLRDRLLLSRGVSFSVRRAARVIAVSEFTRRDLVRRYGIPEERVRVTHAAADPAFRRVADPERLAALRQRYGIPGPYLLSVGNLQPRKNLAALLEAYRQLRGEARLPHSLVVVGQAGSDAPALHAAVTRLGLAHTVIFTGYVPGDDLPGLYSGADLFVHPGLYEGFGLPPLEAMACETPVVAADAGALPEVLGDAAYLVDPRDPAALAAAIRLVLTDSTLAARLVERGRARVRRFSWERTARETAAIYREVLADRGRVPADMRR